MEPVTSNDLVSRLREARRYTGLRTQELMQEAGDWIALRSIEIERMGLRIKTLECERDAWRGSSDAYKAEAASAHEPCPVIRVGDDVSIAHWGETSKVVAIKYFLANGDVLDCERAAPPPGDGQLAADADQLKSLLREWLANHMGGVGPSELYQLAKRTQEVTGLTKGCE
jgi:hypothetical protein